MTEQYIIDYLNQFDLDLRKSKDGTALDMKDTPDIVSYIADCIMNYVDNQISSGKTIEEITFTVRDIWFSDYSIKTAVEVFGKPAPDTPKAVQEYNKFFTLPIKALLYANVLSASLVRRNYVFKVKNLDLLEYISQRDSNAARFLAVYFKKVLTDSNLYNAFETFFALQSMESLKDIRSSFSEFMFRYGLKGQKGGSPLECNRTCNKVINVLAYSERKMGTSRGRVSDEQISLQATRYNDSNFMDKAKGKPKGVTRSEYEGEDRTKARLEYDITRAKRNVDRFNMTFCDGLSEAIPFVITSNTLTGVDVKFELAASRQAATDKHHIFPVSDFPSISTYYENIICLTPEQHYNWAHPHHDTSIVNRDYQYYLLLSKTEQILLNVKYLVGTPDFYNFRRFTKVLDVGLNTDAFERISMNDFVTLKDTVSQYY